MAPAVEIVFVDTTSIVPAKWFNLLQEHLAGFLNLRVDISGTTIVQIVATSSNGAATAYIDGEMRRKDATIDFTFTGEGSATYDVLVTADTGDDEMAMEVVDGTPAATKFRKVAEVDWNGSAITALRGVRGRIEEHTHDGFSEDQVDHADVTGGAAGDPHAIYSEADASDAFTGPQGGKFPPTVSGHLATKAYADQELSATPVGTVIWWPSVDSAPTSFLVAQGQAVSRSIYDALFDVIGTIYGNGDGSSTFNLPDLRGRMIVGDGSSISLGDTDGTIIHTHSQDSHTHSQDSHTHTSVAHTHTGATTSSAGSHTHTQGNTGTSASHTHTGPSHSHGVGSLVVGISGQPTNLVRHAADSDHGLFSENDLDQGSSTTQHSHGAGGYTTCSPVNAITGSTGLTFAAHTHVPAGNAVQHTHFAGVTTGSSASAGTGNTGSAGAHSHTNPNTAAGGSHTHKSGGSTGSTSPSTDSGGSNDTGSAGGDESGTAIVPYLTVNALIRYE